MTTKRTSTKSKRIVANEAIRGMVDQIEAEDRQITTWNYGKVTEEQYQHALERLANGDTMRNVTQELGLSRSALLVRANQHDDFRTRLSTAMEIGMLARLENAGEALAGGEGSTNSIERDKAVADFAKWMAARLGRRMFGDKLQIDQRSVNIIIPRSGVNGDLADW